jgi:hypothetical protein
MYLSAYTQLFTEDPIATIKTALRFAHFGGLALGLGAATMLDLFLVRFFVRNEIEPENWKLVNFSASIVNIGLIVLWATGIGFIVHYALFDPMKLTNEKIWAKLTIVSVLSINGMFIHAVILPRLKQQLGRTLFDGMSRFQRSAFIVSGAVSVVSWYVPVVLGAFPQLNFKVPATVILLAYGAILLAMTVIMHVVIPLMDPSRRSTKGAHPGYGEDNIHRLQAAE